MHPELPRARLATALPPLRRFARSLTHHVSDGERMFGIMKTWIDSRRARGQLALAAPRERLATLPGSPR